MSQGQFSYALFCDDVRFELGNKPSYMGLYGGEMLLPGFPTVLPKLCCIVTFSSPRGSVPRELTAVVYVGDKEMVRQAVPSEFLSRAEQQADSAAEGQDPVDRIAIAINFVINNVDFESPTTVRAVVTADGTDWLAGKLRIRQGPASEVMGEVPMQRSNDQ
jgi:hypothetical protein